MIPFYSDKEDKDFRDVAGAMASAFNTLRFEPDKGLDTALQTIKQQRSARRAKNKTVEYLRGLGQPEAARLANMVETGQLTGQQAYSQIFALEQEKRAADRAAANRAAQAKMAQDAAVAAFERQKELYKYKKGVDAEFAPEPKPANLSEFQTRFNILKASNPEMSDAEILALVDGKGAGGDGDKSPQEAAKTRRQSQSGITVLQDITEAIDIAQEDPMLTTGFVGGILRNVGGTQAKNLASLVSTVQSNIGFDRLDQMRQESPTGGALGQVAVQELNALQASLGNLDTSQTNDQLVRNLKRLETQYRKSMLEIYNAALEDQEKGLINKRTGQVVSPLDYFTQGDINFLTGVGSGKKRIKFDAQGNVVE